MSNTKRQPVSQNQSNEQQHHQLSQQQKTRLEHGPIKGARKATAPHDVAEYHDHERIETRLTR